ncbi:MAG: hydroxyacylglutathione hydrolase [Polyangiaceae bacterium]|nr:hydroxyacylglutathione hydrolase [Polyangiaceae bacterium]
MTHVVSKPRAPFRTKDGKLEIHQIPAETDNLIWLIVALDGSEVAAVDGPEADVVLDYCASRGLKLTTILNTHTHPDHIGVNVALQRSGQLDKMRVVGCEKMKSSIPGITETVGEGDRIVVGGSQAQVWLTEGHLNGHISYVFDGAVFCGDTMFGAGCGYLFDGPASTMFHSLKRLSELDADTWVCCAHEYTLDNLRFAWSLEKDNDELNRRIAESWALRADGGCTVPSPIGLELATNPFLRAHSESLRASLRAAMGDIPLDRPEDVFAAARALKDRGDHKSISDADLPI